MTRSADACHFHSEILGTRKNQRPLVLFSEDRLLTSLRLFGALFPCRLLTVLNGRAKDSRCPRLRPALDEFASSISQFGPGGDTCRVTSGDRPSHREELDIPACAPRNEHLPAKLRFCMHAACQFGTLRSSSAGRLSDVLRPKRRLGLALAFLPERPSRRENDGSMLVGKKRDASPSDRPSVGVSAP